MSEMEQLKKNADDARTTQRIKAVSEYIEKLSAEIDVALEKSKRASIIWGVTAVIWIVLSFVGHGLDALGWLIYLIGLVYSNEMQRRTSRLFGEFRGCIKTLELLGIIDPLPDDSGKKKKKRRSLNELASVVKGWATQKKKAQDAVYSPA